MENFVAWIADHQLISIVILGTAYGLWYVVSHRKELFYKK